jgi:hypothetical protein
VAKMTRRAFSALRVIRIEGTIPSTSVSELLGHFRPKNALCSKSVSSIDMGTIFHPWLGHYLWDTVFLVSSLSF